VGRNRPAEAMPFDGMVRRYLRIYILLTYSLTNERSRSGSTDYALGVAHNTSHILRLFPRLLRLHIGMCSRRSSNGLILPAYARFHPSFTITHDSCVMSTICQSPRASCGCDDSTIVLPSKMDWRRLFQPTWNEPSIRWNKVSARSHKQKKGNTNTQLSIEFIWLMTGCILTPAKNSWSITNHNSIVNRHECHQVLSDSLPLLCHGQSQQRGQPPILAFKQVE